MEKESYEEIITLSENSDYEEIGVIEENTGFGEEKDPTVPEHVKNITEEEKALWDSHPKDTKVHVTSEEKENWNNKADSKDVYSKNEIDKTFAKQTQLPDVSKFITIAVNNLENYYKKTETYTQEEINDKISKIKTSSFEVVEQLPSTDIKSNIIYLVLTEQTEEQNKYTEYVYVNGEWEKLGTLQSTINIEELQKEIEKLQLTVQEKANTKDVYSKSETDNTFLKSADAEKEYAKQTDIPVDYVNTETFNKHATDDSKHVSTEERAKWNNKSDFSGNYEDLNGKPEPYSLPIASADVLGGVKVGENLNIDEYGKLNATGGGSIGFPMLVTLLDATGENKIDLDEYLDEGLYIIAGTGNNVNPISKVGDSGATKSENDIWIMKIAKGPTEIASGIFKDCLWQIVEQFPICYSNGQSSTADMRSFLFIRQIKPTLAKTFSLLQRPITIDNSYYSSSGQYNDFISLSQRGANNLFDAINNALGSTKSSGKFNMSALETEAKKVILAINELKHRIDELEGQING